MKQLLIISLVCSLSGLAQMPSFAWAKSFARKNTVQGGNVASLDHDGNVYTIFNFNDTVDLDPGPGVFTVVGTSQPGNQAIVKMNASGQFLWGTCLTGTVLQATGFEVDVAGNMYVSGYFQNTIDFDPGPGVFLMSALPTWNASFLMKLRPDGSFVWAKSFTGKSFSFGLALDKNADILLTGYYKDIVDFDPGPSTFTLQSTNKDQTYITRLDSSGQLLWVKEFIGNTYNYGETIEIDTSGSILVSGRYWGTVDFDPSSGTQTLSSTKGEIYLAKLDNQGNFMFTKSWYGWWITNLAIDPQNNVNVGLYVRPGITDLDPNTGTFTVNVPKEDVAIIQLDAGGSFSWARTSGGNARLYRICCDNAGQIYAGGGFDSIIDLDFGPGTQTALGGYINPTTAFLISLDQSGNFMWAGTMEATGTNGSAFPYMVVAPGAADDHGNIYSAGWCHGLSCDLDPTSGNHYVSSVNDGYVNKLSLCVSSGTANQVYNLCGAPVGATLSAIGTGTINWYNSVGSTMALASGSTYITPMIGVGSSTYYAESSNCVNKFERTPYVINVGQQPTVQVIGSVPQLCIGETATIQLSGASQYSVNGIPSPVSFTLSPAVTTTLVVTGSSGFDCMDATSYVLAVDLCAGLKESEVSGDRLWPNPVSDVLNFEVEGSASVIIYNSSGQRQMEQHFETSGSIDVSALSQGIYLVDITRGDKSTLRVKLIKN